MSLVALVVVGDGRGNVGIGQGRSAGTSGEIQKGVEDAEEHVQVPLTEAGSYHTQSPVTTVQVLFLLSLHLRVLGIAGGPIRPLFELARYYNVLSYGCRQRSEHD